MRIEYELIGEPCNPVGRDKIYIEVNHDQESVIDQPRPHVGINNLYFAREDVAKIQAYLRNSPGITEGAPFNIKITEGVLSETIKMYLDLTAGFKKSRDGVAVSVKMLQSIDWLDDRVDAFTFESMYNETGVAPFTVDGVAYSSYQQYFDRRCIFIPYVISAIPNWHDAFLAMFSLIYVATELYKVSTKIIQWSLPLPGFGVVYGIGQLVLEIAFALLLVITLIALLNQLVATLIQPIKYHGAMLMSDLLKITAVKLGLSAQSSIWDSSPYNQIAFLPEKYNPIEGAASSFSLMGFTVGGFGSKGYTLPGHPTGPHDSQTAGVQHGYYNGTGGDFLRLIKRFCNGKIIIPDQTDTLVLERRDYYPPNTPYQLPDIRQDWNGYNTDELLATIILKFQSDLNDRNCIDFKDASGNPFYPGTILQATHQQITTVNKLMVCLKGLREIQIAAARGARKDKLNFIEKAVDDLQVVWHLIEDIAILSINSVIFAVNSLIFSINILIAIWNIIIDILHIITNVINVIIDGVNLVPGVDIDHITVFDNDAGKLDYIEFMDYVEFVSLSDSDFNDRIGALLLENDMVDTPKLLLVDTTRSEFASRRIAHVHLENAKTINAKYLLDKFYFIDAFVDPANANNKCNRFTKITPELNHAGEKNLVPVSLKDFKNLVSNPRFLDNFGEEVIADSIQWYIERNGAADFTFRKSGWLADPQNVNALKRAEEIAINLNLKISLPNGQ